LDYVFEAGEKFIGPSNSVVPMISLPIISVPVTIPIRLRVRRHQMTAKIIAMNTTPPTTEPAMIPVVLLDEIQDGSSAGGVDEEGGVRFQVKPLGPKVAVSVEVANKRRRAPAAPVVGSSLHPVYSHTLTLQAKLELGELAPYLSSVTEVSFASLASEKFTVMVALGGQFNRVWT
jgi:hypothetical protein